MASTIPEKLYVTIQYRKDSTEGLLGFASPYIKDAAFAKRKSTQDNWAYGYGASFTIDDTDDSISGEFSEKARFDATLLFSAGCYPRIIDNSLTEGFEIAKSVRRSGWGGGGNVVWRIADPRGYELEISSENFARIIDCTTITNGVIQGKCCWGRDGNKNILLPESSDVYQEAFTKTNKINNKITIGEVTPGDTVELLNKDYENKEVEYLGQYRMMGNGTKLISTAKERYLFRVDGRLDAISAPVVASIVTKAATPLDRAQFAKDYATNSDRLAIGNDPIIILTPNKITTKQVSLKLVDVDFVYSSAVGFPTKKVKYAGRYTYETEISVPLITEYKGKTYVTYTSDNYGRGRSNTLREVDPVELQKGTIEYMYQTIGYYGRSQPNIIEVPAVDLQYKKIVLQYDGVDYEIDDIGYY